jgi:hypothetical protein
MAIFCFAGGPAMAQSSPDGIWACETTSLRFGDLAVLGTQYVFANANGDGGAGKLTPSGAGLEVTSGALLEARQIRYIAASPLGLALYHEATSQIPVVTCTPLGND